MPGKLQKPCPTGARGASTLLAFAALVVAGAGAVVAVAVEIVKSDEKMNRPPSAIFLSMGSP